MATNHPPPRVGRWVALIGIPVAVAALLGACTDLPNESAASTTATASAPAATSTPSASGEPVVAHETKPVASGAELVERFQCARCHDGARTAEVPRDKHCVQCHFQIGEGSFKAPPDILAMWKPRVMHLRFVPSLSGIGRLVKPAWAEQFLMRPFDLRPSSHPEMPRLALDAVEAQAIVAHLAAGAPPVGSDATPAGDVSRGRVLFDTKTCSTCHTFTGAGTRVPQLLEPSKMQRDRTLAPDLRFARERLIPERVAAYIADPASVKPDAAMPKLDISREEAADLAAFVLRTPLDAVAPPAAPPRLPLLERVVSYDEVADKVLHKICWHCHSQPDYARGDGGPGNTGGFGFAARKLDLSSYESIASGYLDRAGERQSLFSKGPGGEPLLLEALLARQRETRGTIGEIRGMPLGLPALSAEDIQLVETWIAQGHPR
ncbi:MAG: c-type cytochrome [Polyangiaceae bacterium]|nr:c-type cytochrome [Polyangiaceae bacterium]